MLFNHRICFFLMFESVMFDDGNYMIFQPPLPVNLTCLVSYWHEQKYPSKVPVTTTVEQIIKMQKTFWKCVSAWFCFNNYKVNGWTIYVINVCVTISRIMGLKAKYITDCVTTISKERKIDSSLSAMTANNSANF